MQLSKKEAKYRIKYIQEYHLKKAQQREFDELKVKLGMTYKMLYRLGIGASLWMHSPMTENSFSYFTRSPLQYNPPPFQYNSQFYGVAVGFCV